MKKKEEKELNHEWAESAEDHKRSFWGETGKLWFNQTGTKLGPVKPGPGPGEPEPEVA